ncbi:2Fe-2S iron-sulfur cluster-binding protein [Flavobacteriaceae bacterium]|nr:2Fe-2S iron-sulfur cluster-binding protein [Flavobacteriaceae bacterium]MDB2336859.1 2Fe-2S iron-sulfur cluster-binding protein [Flavobacteriaceae bacterium]MDB2418211.1 2Fe-2S iron-sulfur cluster-binding protein [Flavobacteriaceae bacterium]MDB2624833.1 2Fe-2S iron-sulfur cluster-binding protein [Flavobacteriaceae bacterium]MDB2660995.1 2Fe-2S iron-sulfur cluster-binding protein [Flavobacteriaceae bacterium]|tara:strand:- start:1965 stop:3011 length:1047 start_codon:yes stop_codon:yes gene_type:complete
MNTFHKLSIKNYIQETANAVSLIFDIPEHLKDNFSFKAGQYVTLKTTIEAKEIRRSYSICSSPNSGELKVAIKRVENGVFSTYAISHLKTGDVIEVHEPEGKFILEPTRSTNYLGIVAGSGITPVLSMIKTVLQLEPSSSFTLIYGNKSSDETMFKTELDALSLAYDTRFNLEYVFSRQNEEGSLFGRIDEGHTNYFIKNIYKNWSFKTAFLCGPEEMIKTVSTTLKENHYKESQILFELFTASINEESSSELKDGQTEVTVLLDDEELSFTMNQKDNILAAALRNDVDAPYSCQGGVCSSCLGKVTQGTAVMVKNSILTDDEVNEGFILTCQAHPTSSKISIDFDDV